MIEIHMDPLGGVAGDMFVAALVHLRPDLEARLARTLSLCPLIEDVDIDFAPHDDGVLTGRRFLVSRRGRNQEAPAHRHLAGHSEHGHVDWSRIREALTTSRLDRKTAEHAVAIFAHLAAAEARIHGVEPDDVRFHEVGAWDSIADIVAAAWLIDEIGASRWTVGPIPLGSGRIRSAHGLLPSPAPATANLLEGFVTIDDGVDGERVTPTGAAILRHLCNPSDQAREPRRLVGSGYGFGARSMPGLSNCLRVLAFETIDAHVAHEAIIVLECEIDDQTGEDLAHAVEHLRAHADVLDVVQAPVFGKKGRMMTQLRVLARPGACDDVIARIFDETTTIGVRHWLVDRSVLLRRVETLDAGGHPVRVKIVERPGGRSVKAEADDLAGVSGGAARTALRRRAEGLSLERDGR
jgi:pyridinium-3,5-bisthiocarboxylic acid mononucleotide nickel chelatase